MSPADDFAQPARARKLQIPQCFPLQQVFSVFLLRAGSRRAARSAPSRINALRAYSTINVPFSMFIPQAKLSSPFSCAGNSTSTV